MSLFPYISGDFAPLIHILDDYDTHRYSRVKRRVVPTHSFAPRFDVYELNDGFHVDGELPGALQNNVEIEFTDPHTLIIKGRTESDYSQGVSDGQVQVQGSITATNTSSIASYQPTVEDEEDTSDKILTDALSNTTNEVKQHKHLESLCKFWV